MENKIIFADVLKYFVDGDLSSIGIEHRFQCIVWNKLMKYMKEWYKEFGVLKMKITAQTVIQYDPESEVMYYRHRGEKTLVYETVDLDDLLYALQRFKHYDEHITADPAYINKYAIKFETDDD